MIGTPKGTIILTTTHMDPYILGIMGPGILNHQVPTLPFMFQQCLQMASRRFATPSLLSS